MAPEFVPEYVAPEYGAPEYLLAPAGAREVDARLAAAGLLDLAMEDTGRAVAAVVQEQYPQGGVLLLAGGGANGGDAFVAARHLLIQGRSVRVLALPAKHPLTRLNRSRFRRVGGLVQPLNERALRLAAREVGVLVDGLLGTGFTPPLRAGLANLIRTVNEWGGRGLGVVAIDLPSGLDAAVADTLTPSVQANHTVTFMGWKIASLFGAAAARSGQVHLAPLAVPPAWVQQHALATRPEDAWVGSLLPVRRADAHKGTAGRVWVLAGQPGMVGAAALAGLGALRSGSGLVTLHSLAEVPLVTPELMIRRHTSWTAFADEHARDRPDAVAVGMGLGPQAVEVARMVLGWRVPTVLDADALHPALIGAGHRACIWTPHPGEAARLLGQPTAAVTRDPLAAALALQAALGGVVVLKGGPSVIAHDEGLIVSRGGHAGMASGGMGDTLSGVLASLLGQGLTPSQAATAGVRLHARAGERAAQRFGYGLGASDVALELGAAWDDLVVSRPIGGEAAAGLRVVR